MAKSRTRQHKQPAAAASPTASPPRTTSALKSDPVLGYKIRVLLHDFRAMTKDKAAEARTSTMTDAVYIGGPYFTPNEATRIKNAIIDHDMPAMEEPNDQADDEDGDSAGQAASERVQPTTVEDAIHARMARFHDKRRASGDARPCGPHDMAPLYEAVFGIPQDEMRDEKFLARLRRQGLPRLEQEPAENSGKTTKRNGGDRK
ncbi:hypothetical protein KJ359_001956 [Pestalotiopsis sp. 9143b]|nr:hypothetical protein KJ359_001956 [Pestalotiopsis sp. 9143b]